MRLRSCDCCYFCYSEERSEAAYVLSIMTPPHPPIGYVSNFIFSAKVTPQPRWREGFRPLADQSTLGHPVETVAQPRPTHLEPERDGAWTEPFDASQSGSAHGVIQGYCNMADYRFLCLGPFPFGWRRRRGKRLVDHLEARNDVFNAATGPAEELGIDIKTAIGLYVMGLSPSGSSVTYPYYVGQAARQTLRARSFQKKDKPEIYSAILNIKRRATPFMYLLPLVRDEGRQATIPTGALKSQTERVIDDAEYMLISMAMRANPDIKNIAHRRALDLFEIDGTPHTSQRRATGGADAFKAMLGLGPPRGRARGVASLQEAAKEAEAQEATMAVELESLEDTVRVDPPVLPPFSKSDLEPDDPPPA